MSMQMLEIRYIGRCKDKGRGSQAMGWVNGSWCAIFPEQVLRDWFEDQGQPGEASTLYAVLGMKQDDADPKSFYRRMALQWHPDRCKEPNAHEQFIRIQEAYQILSDPTKRAKYDAGLKLQASVQTNQYQQKQFDPYGYRSPLKCGMLMVDAQQSGKWFVVKKILAWEDVVRGNLVLVSSWPMGAQQPVEQWV